MLDVRMCNSSQDVMLSEEDGRTFFCVGELHPDWDYELFTELLESRDHVKAFLNIKHHNEAIRSLCDRILKEEDINILTT